VGSHLNPDEELWYHRSFVIPRAWHGQRILLHFGAVDWRTTVWVNGRRVGTHEGGYDPFTFDITGSLVRDSIQQISVSVWDPSDKGFQPAGKQALSPEAIWYTASSGIWQTVWMEPVPTVSIASLKLTPDLDHDALSLTVHTDGFAAGCSIRAIAYDGGKPVAEVRGAVDAPLKLFVKNAKRWSPDHPFLYNIKIYLYNDGKEVDQVKSYFGMRKISLGRDAAGITRLFLNNEPLFQYGPLDQGFWPDGLYTAPTDKAMRSDLEHIKHWGFNMVRKHVKVEPLRWYYYCDKIGLLVWQDMPSGDAHIGEHDPDIRRVAQSAFDYKKELVRMISAHYNHPCIVTWVPFNEGWGQFDTRGVVALVKQFDTTRLVDATTGWADRRTGDMHDMHQYPGPAMFPAVSDRASVLGEFGGQALVVKNHLWLTDLSKAPSHYKTSTSSQALHERYRAMTDSLIVLKKDGLAAAVYTQLTDVELEVNGLMTYDRRIMKFDEAKLREMNQAVISK
jgi:beta-galactosidase/beta-glucuronidase